MEVKFIFDGTADELYADLIEFFEHQYKYNKGYSDYLVYEGRAYSLLRRPMPEHGAHGKIQEINYEANSRPINEEGNLQGIQQPAHGIKLTLGLYKKNRGLPLTIECLMPLWEEHFQEIVEQLCGEPYKTSTEQPAAQVEPLESIDQAQVNQHRDKPLPSEQRIEQDEQSKTIGQPGKLALGDKPPQPESGTKEEWNIVFDWFYRQSKFKNINDLLHVVPSAMGTIYNQHSRYMLEFEKKPMPDRQSIFISNEIVSRNE